MLFYPRQLNSSVFISLNSPYIITSPKKLTFPPKYESEIHTIYHFSFMSSIFVGNNPRTLLHILDGNKTNSSTARDRIASSNYIYKKNMRFYHIVDARPIFSLRQIEKDNEFVYRAQTKQKALEKTIEAGRCINYNEVLLFECGRVKLTFLD